MLSTFPSLCFGVKTVDNYGRTQGRRGIDSQQLQWFLIGSLHVDSSRIDRGILWHTSSSIYSICRYTTTNMKRYDYSVSYGRFAIWLAGFFYEELVQYWAEHKTFDAIFDNIAFAGTYILYSVLLRHVVKGSPCCLHRQERWWSIADKKTEYSMSPRDWNERPRHKVKMMVEQWANVIY